MRRTDNYANRQGGRAGGRQPLTRATYADHINRQPQVRASNMVGLMEGILARATARAEGRERDSMGGTHMGQDALRAGLNQYRAGGGGLSALAAQSDVIRGNTQFGDASPYDMVVQNAPTSSRPLMPARGLRQHWNFRG